VPKLSVEWDESCALLKLQPFFDEETWLNFAIQNELMFASLPYGKEIAGAIAYLYRGNPGEIKRALMEIHSWYALRK
jgi:hypothetical protein